MSPPIGRNSFLVVVVVMPDSFLMTETLELTCGVCKDLFRNPYLLPCDHSFCRRPCLLPTPSSTCAICIYCHIGVHVSELERNYELDDRVQSYLAKRRNLESQRVPCYLCRSLYDHCTMCSHCNRQLCDLCFKEHVGEFHTMIRIKCQSLQNEASQLRQARASLVSRRTTVKTRRGMLSKSVGSASSDLLSACKIAFSRAEERLDRVHAQSNEKITTMLNNQRLVGLAVNLLRALNNPAEHEDTQRLCEMRKVAQSAIETLTAIETPELRNDRYQFENFTLAGGLQTIGVQLRNLHLLVDQKSTAVATGTKMCLQGNSQRPTSSAPDTADSLKTSGRIQHGLDRQPLLSKRQHEFTKQKAIGPAEPLQQQQKALQDRLAVGRSQKALQIYVDGVKANIPAEDLKTHFARFGEVLDMCMLMNRVTDKHNGNGYITLRPTRDPSQILETDHIIRGVRINIKECYSSDVEGNNWVRLTEDSKKRDANLQPDLSEHQVEIRKQSALIPTEPVQRQQQQQRKEAVGTSQKVLEVHVKGVKAYITAEDLKTHFARFGQVLEVYVFMSYSTDKHNGNGLITLRPTRDPSQILETDHIIRGVRINVEDCYSSDDEGNWMRLTEDSKKRDANLQPDLSEHQVEIRKQSALIPTEPVQRQQQQQRKEAVGTSQKVLEVHVKGVKAYITAEDLKTHFARFGQVLEVYVFMSYSTDKHNGNGLITLRPTRDPSQILETDHIIRGVRINVEDCYSSDDEGNWMRLTEDSKKMDANFQLAVSEHQVEITKQKASGSTEPVRHQQQEQELQQQQRKDLHNCEAVGASQKPLEIYVDGVKANITAEDLRTHFARFGQVLDVYMLMNCSTDKHTGNGYITLQPTRDPSQILETDHIIRGVRINIKECYSSDVEGNDLVRLAEDSKKKDANMELSLLGHQVEMTKEVSSPTEHVQQQQQQRPAQQKLQQQRSDLQNCQAVGRSQKALEIYVNGVKANITAEDLKTHFASFGKVLNVHMCKNPSTKKHNGNGYITLQPTRQPRQILQTEHIIRGTNSVRYWPTLTAPFKETFVSYRYS
ncbi:hypothetical protein SprV_0200954100 [Sparganum proliferum]